MNQKSDKLKEIIRPLKQVLVAFSGGVDSTLLLKVALDTLGNENVLAVIAQSVTYPEEEIEGAKKIAEMLKANYQVIHTNEICDENFYTNPPERCYFCKLELFSTLKKLASDHGIQYVLEGSNLDDTSDYRPGLRAIKELEIVSPLKQAGLTKDEIRSLSKSLGLPTWSKPSMACLASRFPYSYQITEPELKMVEQAERFLRKLGFVQLRVRHHGKLARIEVEPNQLEKLIAPENRLQIITYLKSLGYVWIAMDLQGYRTGSFNESLNKKED
jgi:uncharacterized protein